MLFKFLTGKEIGPLQTGLILSQVGGLVMIFIVLNAVGLGDHPTAALLVGTMLAVACSAEHLIFYELHVL